MVGSALTEPIELDNPRSRESEYVKAKIGKHGMVGKETEKLGKLSHLGD